MVHPMTILGIDPICFGKVDKESLSQKTLMELVIDGIENRSEICVNAEDPNNLSEWIGVILDDEGNIMLADWKHMDLIGSLHLQWLPDSLMHLSVAENETLYGSMNLTTLPSRMNEADFCHNKFAGEISLATLPDSMRKLDVSTNELCGSLDLQGLPKGLLKLRFGYNKFSGSICLENLPQKLEYLDVSCNFLSGSINLHKLPTGMRKLYLDENDITADIGTI